MTHIFPLLYLYDIGLLRLWSVNRANVRACAAIDASRTVDDVDRVTCSDAADWALRLASAARDAGILNYICHLGILLKYVVAGRSTDDIEII